MEHKEDLISAVRREVREETGVEIEVGKLGGVYSGMNHTPMIFFYFHAEYVSGELRTSDESPEVEWLTLEEARARITMPVVRDRLEELVEEGTVTYAATLGGWGNRPYKVITRRSI